MKVVVVEDDEMLRDALRWTLDLDGWDLVMVASVPEAQSIDWRHVDAAAIDYMLGSAGSGVDLAVWLRETHPHVSTAICTAAPSGAIQEIARRSITWLQVVAKPFTADDLRAVWKRQERPGA